MTHRRNISAAAAVVLTAVALSAPVSAQANNAEASGNERASVRLADAIYVDVIKSLEEDGYNVTKVTRTFLGRFRILARDATRLREVIVSSSTGEIKRDAIIETFSDDTAGGRDDASSDMTSRNSESVSGTEDSPAGAEADIGADVDVGSGSASTGGSVSGSVGLGGDD